MKLFLALVLFISILDAQDYEQAYKMYQNGDLENSFKEFNALCNENNFVACFSAGNILNELNLKLKDNKDVSKKDKLEIMKKQNHLMLLVFRKSCDGGYIPACNNYAFFQNQVMSFERENPTKDSKSQLPLFLQDSKNITPSNEELLSFYDRACSAGNYEACNNLALMYERQGPGSQTRALSYYDIACKNNNVASCFDIATKYYGSGEFNNAFEYFNKTCSLGVREGCLNVGIMYEKNEAPKIDNVQDNAESKITNYTLAMEYYSKACGMGEKNACEYLQNLSQRLYKAK